MVTNHYSIRTTIVEDASADDNPDSDSLPQLQDASSSGAAASSPGNKRKLEPEDVYPTQAQIIAGANVARGERYPTDDELMEAALPAQVADWRATRLVLEFCCSETSLMGSNAYQTGNCLVVRLTAERDMASQAGIAYAMNVINNMGEGVYVFLWASMPCTGGSPWQRMNKKRASARARIAEHLGLHHQLFDN